MAKFYFSKIDDESFSSYVQVLKSIVSCESEKNILKSLQESQVMESDAKVVLTKAIHKLIYTSYQSLLDEVKIIEGCQEKIHDYHKDKAQVSKIEAKIDRELENDEPDYSYIYDLREDKKTLLNEMNRLADEVHESLGVSDE